MTATAPGRLERVADGFDFPTSLAFAPDGTAYVGESGLPFAGAPPGGRVWRLPPGGERTLVASGLPVPLTGLTWAGDELYISASGGIARLDADGRLQRVIDGLPTGGNYHTNMVAVGPDGWIYFGQGAMTNSGIVGPDALDIAWLKRLPHPHDVPGLGLTLTGAEARAEAAASTPAVPPTGAFVPYGTPALAGRRVAAGLPCTAGVMRCRRDGSGLETVAWGLRNAFGLGFLPDGRLIAIDQGADDRGTRPLGNVPDLVFEVRPGAWCGWPDFIGDVPVTAPDWRPERGAPPTFLIANHADLPRPQAPLFRFAAHAAATKFDVSPPGGVAPGELVVTLFGDERPMTAPAGPPMGRCVVTLDLAAGRLRHLVGAPLVRPIDVRFHPQDARLHVLDFGHFEMLAGGGVDATRSGVLWRLGA